MMNIEICKWFNNSDSPVMFMIDDLANVWVDTTKSGELELGEDWGYWKNEEKSSFRYLNEVVLKEFPEVKATFFVPVGVRVGMIKEPVAPSISKEINHDEATKKFFRDIHQNPRFEIAYHGTTHGKVGETNLDFKQEWELFSSLEKAVDVVEEGKRIYKDAIGVNPLGGKYCGYTSNEFSDLSIDKTDFLWWCRYWNRGIEEGEVDKVSGRDKNSLSNYDIKKFGDNNVIDIPSTVNGGLLTSVLNSNFISIKGILKKLLKNYLVQKRLQQIEYLLKRKLVISIQEHIAPSRDDGRRQMPNIFDDTKSLQTIFRYLRNKNVWYCTGTELASYVYLRDNFLIKSTSEGTFYFVQTKDNNRDVELGEVTLSISGCEKRKLLLPNQTIKKVRNGIVNVPIMSGTYQII